ncbi:vitelline membrane outer layer protein 1-like [Ctenopharyngodon idella]|uniref:vitelline membrane outer layer protein 1-like n=1 Tax=Ctenopharyngodon idella TaxID=7959 RepID=UPI002230C614|nr:vitelline membrane outer layer protein 1-like [Ctenopharyngodon idella]
MHHFLSIVFLLLAIGLHVSVQSTGKRSERSTHRSYKSTLTVGNGKYLGSWGFTDMCPSGTYAAGFSLKVEETSYFRYDNTALNGIRLHCINPSSPDEDYITIESRVAKWGEWTAIKWCPSGFLKAFQLRVEPDQGLSDDTAANNIRFKCIEDLVVQGDGTDRGEWGEWSQKCEGIGICGIRTRIEEPQGTGDDTALNDVQMYCCA